MSSDKYNSDSDYNTDDMSCSEDDHMSDCYFESYIDIDESNIIGTKRSRRSNKDFYNDEPPSKRIKLDVVDYNNDCESDEDNIGGKMNCSSEEDEYKPDITEMKKNNRKRRKSNKRKNTKSNSKGEDTDKEKNEDKNGNKNEKDTNPESPEITIIYHDNNEGELDPFMRILDFISNKPQNPQNKKTVAKKRKVVEPCPNPNCSHTDEVEVDECMTPAQVDTIGELIKLGELYHCKQRRTYYGINLRVICKLIPTLKELDSMIGLSEAKKDVVQNILYFSQPIESIPYTKDGVTSGGPCGKCIDCSTGDICLKGINCDMLHTIITGPPGVGKTTFAKILCKIYTVMGFLSKGTFNTATRSDLVGEYLGHTAVRTQEVYDKSSGGVLFIDEFYSLGSVDGRDSFAKECIDTLTLNAEKNRDTILFVAGYKKQMYEQVFNQNEGLRRRFAFEYNLQEYTGDDLAKILICLIHKNSWNFDDNKIHDLNKFINKNKNKFIYNGGDMETLLLYVKIVMKKRLMFKKDVDKRMVTFDDIKAGFDTFLVHRSYTDSEEDSNSPPLFMYI